MLIIFLICRLVKSFRCILLLFTKTDHLFVLIDAVLFYFAQKGTLCQALNLDRGLCNNILMDLKEAEQRQPEE